MNAPHWAHGSLAVVVPVARTAGHVLPTGRSGWELEGLFSSGTAFSTPNKVAWDPIADERIRWALDPVLDDRCVAAKAERKPTVRGDEEDLDESGAAGARATPRAGGSVMPQLEDLVKAAGWLAATTRGQTEGPDAATGPHRQASAPLPNGCVVRAVEELHLPNYGRQSVGDDGQAVRTGPEDLDSFVVIHVLLTGEALADPGEAAAYFSHPAVNTDLRVGYHAKDPEGAGAPLRVMTFVQWAGFLANLGFAPIGPMGTAVTRSGAVCSLRAWRPFVVSHLVPSEGVPASPFAPAPGLERWDAAHAWGWRMTAGQRLTQTWEPGRGAADPVRDGVWMGSTWVRAAPGGLAFVATRGLQERGTVHQREGATWWRKGFHNVEHVRTAGLVHRNAVRLAVLGIRQSEKLQAHAEALATGISWPEPPVEADPDSEAMQTYEKETEQTAETALGLELDLIRTRNQVWFSQLPGRPEEGAMLQALQSAAGTPELLADVELEQQQVARVLEQQSLRVRTAREKRAEAARAEEVRAQEKRDRKLGERDRKLGDALGALSAFIGLFFIVDLALAITQVRQGGGWDDVRGAFSVAIPVLVILGLGLWMLFRRFRPEKESGDDQGRSS